MPGEFIARQGLISRGNVVVTGSLTTSGSLTTTGTITATTLVVQTITSSISSITGSTNFGSLSTNTHTFTGSMLVTGSVTAAKVILSGGANQSELTNTTNNDFKLTNSGSFRIVNGANTSALLTVTNGGTSSFSGNVLVGTSTDSTSGFNKVLAISNDYLPSLELRKTGSIGGARTYNLAIGNTGGFTIYDATAAADRLIVTNEGITQIIAADNQTTNGGYTSLGNLYVASATAQGTGVGGSISIGGRFNNAGAYATFARIQGKKENSSSGQTGGYLAFEVNTDVTNLLTERMRINSSGQVTIPNQPSFYATSTAGSSTYGAGEVIVFNTARHNSGAYNTSNGRFTAPVAGRYLFAFNVYNYTGYSNSIVLTINGSQYAPQDVQPLSFAASDVGGSLTTGFTIVWELAVNDYVEVRTRAGGSANIYRAHSHFTGHLLG